MQALCDEPEHMHTCEKLKVVLIMQCCGMSAFQYFDTMYSTTGYVLLFQDK